MTPVGFEQVTHAADNLIAGPSPQTSRKVTLLSGENRTRGALLGKITLGAPSSAAKAGGNTGDGTLTLDVTTPIKAGAKPGVYTVRCIAAAADGGIFEVRDPDGFVIGGTIIIAGGAGGTGAFDDDIKFVLTDGSADFIVGDGFDVTIAAGSGKYKLSAAAALDGSQTPDLVLALDCDASEGDAEALTYTEGYFSENNVILGAGHTADSIREGLRVKGVHLVKTQPA